MRMILIDYQGLDVFVRVEDGKAFDIYTLVGTRPEQYRNVTRMFYPQVIEAMHEKALARYAEILEDEAAEAA